MIHFSRILEKKTLQLQYRGTDSFVLNLNTIDIGKGLQNLNDLFDFSNLNKEHEVFSNRNNNMVGKYKRETPKTGSGRQNKSKKSRLYVHHLLFYNSVQFFSLVYL